MSPAGPSVNPERFDAVLFDLDGVLTATAQVHAACWVSKNELRALVGEIR